MTRPARGVYWRREADVALIATPNGVYRLMGDQLSAWDALVAAAEPTLDIPKLDTVSEKTTAELREQLLNQHILEAGDGAQAWIDAHVQHLPSRQ